MSSRNVLPHVKCFESTTEENYDCTVESSNLSTEYVSSNYERNLSVLPNVWEVKDPFEPHSSLVREINEYRRSSNTDLSVSSIDKKDQSTEVSNSFEDINTGTSSPLIKEYEVFRENDEEYQADIEKFDEDKGFKQDYAFSTLISNDKTQEENNTQSYEVSSDNSADSECSFKTARSALSIMDCFNKQLKKCGKTIGQSLSNSEMKGTLQNSAKFSLKLNNFLNSDENQSVDQHRAINSNYNALLDSNYKTGDFKNVPINTCTSESKVISEYCKSQSSEEPNAAKEQDDKIEYSNTVFFKLSEDQRENQEIEFNANKHLGLTEQNDRIHITQFRNTDPAYNSILTESCKSKDIKNEPKNIRIYESNQGVENSPSHFGITTVLESNDIVQEDIKLVRSKATRSDTAINKNRDMKNNCNKHIESIEPLDSANINQHKGIDPLYNALLDVNYKPEDKNNELNKFMSSVLHPESQDLKSRSQEQSYLKTKDALKENTENPKTLFATRQSICSDYFIRENDFKRNDHKEDLMKTREKTNEDGLVKELIDLNIDCKSLQNSYELSYNDSLEITQSHILNCDNQRELFQEKEEANLRDCYVMDETKKDNVVKTPYPYLDSLNKKNMEFKNCNIQTCMSESSKQEDSHSPQINLSLSAKEESDINKSTYLNATYEKFEANEDSHSLKRNFSSNSTYSNKRFKQSSKDESNREIYYAEENSEKGNEWLLSETPYPATEQKESIDSRDNDIDENSLEEMNRTIGLEMSPKTSESFNEGHIFKGRDNKCLKLESKDDSEIEKDETIKEEHLKTQNLLNQTSYSDTSNNQKINHKISEIDMEKKLDVSDDKKSLYDFNKQADLNKCYKNSDSIKDGSLHENQTFIFNCDIKCLDVQTKVDCDIQSKSSERIEKSGNRKSLKTQYSHRETEIHFNNRDIENQNFSDNNTEFDEKKELEFSKDNNNGEISVHDINKLTNSNGLVKDGRMLTRNLSSNFNDKRLMEKFKGEFNIQISGIRQEIEKDGKWLHLKTQYPMTGSPKSDISFNENQNLNNHINHFLPRKSSISKDSTYVENCLPDVDKTINSKKDKDVDETKFDLRPKRNRSPRSNFSNKRLKLESVKNTTIQINYTNKDLHNDPNDGIDENRISLNNEEPPSNKMGHCLFSGSSFQQNTSKLYNIRNSINRFQFDSKFVEGSCMKNSMNKISLREHENKNLVADVSQFKKDGFDYKNLQLFAYTPPILLYNRYNTVSSSTQTDHSNVSYRYNTGETNIGNAVNKDDSSKQTIDKNGNNSFTNFVGFLKQKQVERKECIKTTDAEFVPNNLPNFDESTFKKSNLEADRINKPTSPYTGRSSETYLSKESLEKLNEVFPAIHGDHSNYSTNVVEYVNSWIKTSVDTAISEGPIYCLDGNDVSGGTKNLICPMDSQDVICSSDKTKLISDGYSTHIMERKALDTSSLEKTLCEYMTKEEPLHKAKRKGRFPKAIIDNLSKSAWPLILKRPVRQEGHADLAASMLTKSKHFGHKTGTNDHIEDKITKRKKTSDILNENQGKFILKSRKRNSKRKKFSCCTDQLSKFQRISGSIRPSRQAKNNALIKLKNSGRIKK